MNADGSSSLVFYGGTSRFDVTGDGLPPLSIQVGRANCVAYNRPSIYRSLIGKADLVDKRVGLLSTKLPDGRVLITGGAELDANGNVQSISDTVELYDPVHGQFISLLDASGIPVRMSQPRAFHTAVALADGSVLLAGGQLTAAGDLSNSVSMFFPNGPIFEGPVNAPDFIARKSHRARRLNDGSVLLAGGLDLNGQPLASTYRYFPADQSFRPQGDMATARSGHSLNDIERGGELGSGCGRLQRKWCSADHRDFHDECESNRMFWWAHTQRDDRLLDLARDRTRTADTRLGTFSGHCEQRVRGRGGRWVYIVRSHSSIARDHCHSVIAEWYAECRDPRHWWW